MPDAKDYCLVISTCPDSGTARTIANALIEQRLAACVNIVPQLTSIYRWQDNVETAEEAVMVIKTTRAAYKTVEQELCKLHPYELPEIIAVPLVDGLTDYLTWIGGNVR